MIEKRQFYIGITGATRATGRDHRDRPVHRRALRGDQSWRSGRYRRRRRRRPGRLSRLDGHPPGRAHGPVEKLYEIYKARTEEMAQAISLEMGAPIDLARQQQAPAGIGNMKGFLKAGQEFEFSRAPARGRATPDHPRARRRGGHDHPVELADEPDHAQGYRRACRRLHDGAQALRGIAARCGALRRDDGRGGPFRRGSSTSSTATARAWAASFRRTRTWT